MIVIREQIKEEKKKEIKSKKAVHAFSQQTEHKSEGGKICIFFYSTQTFLS